MYFEELPMAELQVQYLSSYDLENWGEIKFALDGDACFDLRIVEDVVLYAESIIMVGTGIRVSFAPEYVLHAYPRSGLACKKGVTLANSPATIDSGYRGEIKLGLLNTINHTIKIERGTRVAQARLCNLVPTKIITVTSLDETERGEGGFSSTGIL